MKRAVRATIRLVAAGLLVLGGMELGLEFVRHSAQRIPFSLWHCLLSGLFIAIGLVLMAVSGRLAESLTDDFED